MQMFKIFNFIFLISLKKRKMLDMVSLFSFFAAYQKRNAKNRMSYFLNNTRNVENI